MIDTNMKIIRANGNTETSVRALTAEPGYDVLRRLINPILDGSGMERVAVWADFHGGTKFEALDMFVDELCAIKRLPRNEIATAHYRRATMMGLTGVAKPSDPESIPAIYGTAILFSRRVWF